MVIQCKHCGAASKVDDAKMPSTTFRIKCHKCQNILTVEPPKAAAPAIPTVSATPVEPAPRPAAAKPAAAPAAEAPPLPPRTHYLQKIDLFSALSYEDCLAVESKLGRRELAPNQVVVKEGGPGDSMYFINAGAVEVRKKDLNTGIEFLLTELKAGACFGEMSLLTAKPRAAWRSARTSLRSRHPP